MLGIGGLPLTNPFTMYHCFLLQGTLNRVRIILYIVSLNLTLPSSTKHFFLKGPSTEPGSNWLLVTSLCAEGSCLFHPPGIFSFSSMAPSTGPGLGLILLDSLWLFYQPWIISCFTRALWIGPGSCWLLLEFPWLFHSPWINLVYTKIILVIAGLPLTV